MTLNEIRNTYDCKKEIDNLRVVLYTKNTIPELVGYISGEELARLQLDRDSQVKIEKV